MRSKQNTRRSSSCESGGGAGCWSHTDPAMNSEKKRKEEKATAIFFTEPRCRSGCGELENEIYQRQRVQQVIKLSSLPAKKKRGGRDKAARSPLQTLLFKQHTYEAHTTPITYMYRAGSILYSHRQPNSMDV